MVRSVVRIHPELSTKQTARENVEIVRALYAEGGPLGPRLSPDDAAFLDRMFRVYYDERVEVHMPPDYPEGGQVFRGRAGFERLIAMLRDSWSEFRFEAERFIDAGDRVVVLIRLRASGGASGVTTERETAHVWTVRDGRLTCIQIYRDRAEALEAVGLQG
jgi:ketosteroid isomerase-like protein